MSVDIGDAQAAIEAARAAQAEEYGQFVAAVPIDIDGARAFNPGHAVPVSTVQRFGLDSQGLVERQQSAKAAKAAATSEKGAK